MAADVTYNSTTGRSADVSYASSPLRPKRARRVGRGPGPAGPCGDIGHTRPRARGMPVVAQDVLDGSRKWAGANERSFFARAALAVMKGQRLVDLRAAIESAYRDVFAILVGMPPAAVRIAVHHYVARKRGDPTASGLMELLGELENEGIFGPG